MPLLLLLPLAQRRPMGWMSWEIFRCQTDCTAHPSRCVNAQLYTQMADHLVADGCPYFQPNDRARCSTVDNHRLTFVCADLAAGYTTVSIDDCWEAPRTPEGTLKGDPRRFPLGMKALGDHLHSKGVHFGMCAAQYPC